MIGFGTILKVAGIAVAVALPVTLPTLVEGCTKCIRAGENLTKELSLGILNCMTCGAVQIVRKVLSEMNGSSGTLGGAKPAGGGATQ